MKAVIIDAGSPSALFPITCTRPLAACPVANVPLRDAQLARLQSLGFSAGTGKRRGASGEGPVARGSATGSLAFYVPGDTWLSEMALRRAAAAREALLLRDASGDLLAWVGRSEEAPTEAASVTVEGCIKIRYPWDLLAVNAAAVAEACRAGSATTDLGAGVTVDGAVVVGSGTRFLPGVYIEGNVVVGRDCKIGPNCYIRGATSIGDGCHVGQAVEIKNSILMAGVGIGHLSYCGDSVVGVKANFGAGTITANFRHDGQSHRSKIGAQLVNTGLRKLGATIGDGVHTGIHTSIYPGRKIWPGQSTRPGAVVQSDVVGDSGCR